MDPSQSDPRLPTSAAASGQRDAGSAERIARAARAAEQLCAALWEALHEELRGSPAEVAGTQAAELAERLAQVCASVADLARCSTPVSLATARARAVVPEVAAESFPEPPATSREIAIRDARGEGPSVWVQVVGYRLERYRRDARPFAALLVEVADAEGLPGAQPAAEHARLLARVQAALRQELRPVDDLTLESPGRWWLTLAHTDAHAARTVAARLVETVNSLTREPAAAPRIAIGIASCPEDGHDAASLAAHADVGLYAARAAGRTLPPA
jgi:GGDEF domain-containing protein